MQKFKYLALAITCFLLGSALLQPAVAHYVASKDAHTLAKHHASYYASRAWVRKYFASRAWTKKYFYTKGQSDSRFVNQSGDSISGNLTVSGDINADSLNLNSAKFQQVMISASDFDGYGGDNVVRSYYGAVAYAGGQGRLVAGLNLPHGVEITEMELHYADADPADNFSVTLYRNPMGSNVGEPVCTVASTGDAGYGSITTNSITNGVVNNVNYEYFLYVLNASSTNLQLQSVRIKYSFNTI